MTSYMRVTSTIRHKIAKSVCVLRTYGVTLHIYVFAS